LPNTQQIHSDAAYGTITRESASPVTKELNAITSSDVEMAICIRI
jgi:hypothetical protein